MDQVSQAVMVPVHADVLVLRHDTPVLEPMADFSRLPYATPAGDANADVAYVSEEILSCPFEDSGHMLRAGVHLHWSLPDALRRGVSHGVLFGKELYDFHAKELDAGIVPEDVRELFASHGLPLSAGASAVRIARRSQRWHINDPQNERSYTARAGTHWELDATGVRRTPRLNIHAGKLQFPPVPNRWLVSRTIDNGQPTQWVVESDYLHAPQGPPTDAISYPHSDDERSEPFRRLGRQWTLDDWMEKSPEDGEYLDRLTAVGYGEPTFAAFYPNCHSVFGFHDDELAGDLAACGVLIYDVIGWFSDLANDCVCSTDFMEALDATVARYSLQDALSKNDAQALKTFNALRFETLDRRYGWKVEPDGDTPFPRRTLCYARVKIDGAGFRFGDDTQQDDARRKVTVAVANTGTEALSAYLAECLPHGGGDHDHKSKLEEQLEALQLKPRLQGRQLDLGAKFREARDEQGFSGVSGGTCWTVAPADDASNSSESPGAPPPPLPAAIAPLLDRLNAEQARCDRLDYELESMQTQLYADWCKYMLCAYPPGDAIDVFPDMDDARDFVERRLLGPLADKSDDAQAAHVECTRTQDEVATVLAAFPPQGSAPLKLKRLPAPRFWKPTDPVVLIAGEATGAAISHMQAVTRPCRLMPGASHHVELHFDELLAAVAQHATDEPSGLHQCAEQSWHPFLLEWRVGLHAAGPGGYVPMPSSFVGRSLVTAYAASQLRERLEAVLTDSDSHDPVTESLSAVLDELRREECPNYWCLTQALSGFNDALLMHKRTLQLPVDDPLGFEDARAFAEGVRKAVGRRNRTAPQPFDDFLPIRTRFSKGTETTRTNETGGHHNFEVIALEVVDLRLVDTFGRVQDLQFDHQAVIAPDAMTVPGRHDLVALPPRLVQPARLNFRWLPGAGDDGGSSVVCGWIVHNRFDCSLAVHAASGALLGAIALDEARWRPAPGSLFPSSVDEIDDAHLRSLVAWLMGADRDAMADQIERSLEWIEPEDFAPHPIAAFLVGRPLAVVRATLGLELRGLPAVDQSWPAFEHAMAADDAFARDSDGFTRVPFAVRLGDPGQLNDGLVALWRETPAADRAGVGLQQLPHVRGSEPQLQLAVADPPVQLTMLVDPRCVVHAAADILPAKSIGLPQDQVLHALSRLQSSLRIGPVLMPDAHVRMPLPAEPGFEWTWVERRLGVWRTAGAIERPLAGASWEAPQALRDGWIRRTPANRTEVSG